MKSQFFGLSMKKKNRPQDSRKKNGPQDSKKKNRLKSLIQGPNVSKKNRKKNTEEQEAAQAEPVVEDVVDEEAVQNPVQEEAAQAEPVVEDVVEEEAVQNPVQDIRGSGLSLRHLKRKTSSQIVRVTKRPKVSHIHLLPPPEVIKVKYYGKQNDDEILFGQHPHGKGHVLVLNFPKDASVTKNLDLFAITLHTHQSFAPYLGCTERSDEYSFCFSSVQRLDKFLEENGSAPAHLRAKFARNAMSSIARGAAHLYTQNFSFKTLLLGDIVVNGGDAQIVSYDKLIYHGNGSNLSSEGGPFVPTSISEPCPSTSIMSEQVALLFREMLKQLGLLFNEILEENSDVVGCSLIHDLKNNRVDLNNVQFHPFFWNPRKRLEFISDLAELLKTDMVETGSFDAAVTKYEMANKVEVFSKKGGIGSWYNEVDEPVQLLCHNGSNYPGEASSLVMDIRNAGQHIREQQSKNMPAHTLFKDACPHEHLEDIKSGVWPYFESKFKNLLLFAYDFCTMFHKNDAGLSRYWKY